LAKAGHSSLFVHFQLCLPRPIPIVWAQPLVAELIAVDDGSSDQTWEHLSAFQGRDPRLILRRHETNRGKGAAVRTGCYFWHFVGSLFLTLLSNSLRP
jgi:cellulose synthase/poly-beta-1,6-N-acetylglucosamine synthase-like glycosyltransferase